MMTGSITPLFKFAMSCDLHILLQCTAVNVIFLLNTFKDSADSIFLGLAYVLRY
jgi:hypothetical protein